MDVDGAGDMGRSTGMNSHVPVDGAGEESRTLMRLPPLDFEYSASQNPFGLTVQM